MELKGVMMAATAVVDWAEQNFGAAELGNRQRTRRLGSSAAPIARHPQKAFTQVFDWNELRGFYRLCAQSEATLAALQEPHRAQTRRAMTQLPLVLILHATCELDFSSHKRLQGAGQIGNAYGRGFLQHNSLAVLPQPRQVLGLVYQQLRLRQPAPKGESMHQRKKRPRESDLWPEGFRGVGPAPQGACWVDVCDAGSDDYEAMRAARALGHHFLLRITQNRIVFLNAAHDHQAYVLEYARSLPSKGSATVEIAGRGGRAARTATVHWAAAPVWVPAATGTPQRRSQPILPAWVIRIWEPHPPAGIDEPLEWVLLCSLPSQRLAELKERRDWYACRWMLEVFHAIEKNGCSEEDRRLRTAQRMEACLAVLSIVAVRVFQLRWALEHQGHAPAEQVGTQQEIDLVRRFLKHTRRQYMVRAFVRGVARLGGYLGRRADGPPGVRALWRGYQRLQDMLLGLQLHASPNSS